MQNWEYKKLGELSTEKMSYGTSASSCEYDGEVRYIRITDINDEGHLNDDFVSPESYEEKHVLQDGDIVFARTGATVGKAYCYHESGEKYVYAGYLIRLRPNKQLVNSDYLYYCTKSKDYLEFIRTSQTAAAQPNVNAEKYSNFEIPLPPLEEQKRIVKILDEKFAMLETVKANAKINLQNTKDLFQAELSKLYTSTNKIVKISDIAQIKGGKRIPKGKKLVSENTGHPYIRVTDFTDDGSVSLDDIHYITEDIYQTICRYIISTKDVFISIAGTIGKVGTVPEELNNANLTENACKLVLNDSAYNKYIVYLFQSDEVHAITQENARANAMPKLSITRLSNIEIPLPPLSEQKRIVEQLDSLSEKVRSLEEIYTKQLANCDELKQVFLAKAFAGEL